MFTVALGTNEVGQKVHASYTQPPEVNVSGPLAFHLVLGIVIVAIGLWLLKQRKTTLGWTLSGIGTAFAVMGVVVRILHWHLPH